MDYLYTILETIQSVKVDPISFLIHATVILGCILVLGFLIRLLLGKQSGLNHAISSAIGILFLYILGAMLYGTSTYLSGLLASLPFVAVANGNLALFCFHGADFQQICEMLVRCITLAFFVNLLDTMFPKGKNFFMWLLFRLLTVFLSVIIQTLLVWAASAFLPADFLKLAPMILLGILVLMLLLGALKLLVGIALTAVNPIIAAFYTFFFASMVGKQISKAVVTTGILCAIVAVLNHFGFVVISLSLLALPVLLPVIIVLAGIWYLINRVL